MMKKDKGKKIVWALLLLRVLAFSVFLYSAYCYTAEKDIMSSTTALPYGVVKLDCRPGRSGLTTVWIANRGKEYSVSVKRAVCENLTVGGTFNVYHNTTMDYFL